MPSSGTTLGPVERSRRQHEGLADARSARQLRLRARGSDRVRRGYQHADPCGAGDPQPGCQQNVGFRLNVYNAYTRDVRPGDSRVYNTGRPDLTAQQQTAELQRLVTDLGNIAPGDTIALQTMGRPQAAQTSYPPPVGNVGRGAMAKLADAIANMGGTRRGIVSAATVSGSSDRNGGLGISMPAYVLSQKVSFWEGSQAGEDDHCGWPAPGP